MKFLFQTGAIKRVLQEQQENPLKGFYSKLVRLKVHFD